MWVSGGDAPFRAPSGSLSIADGEGWGKKAPGELYKGRVPPRTPQKPPLVKPGVALA